MKRNVMYILAACVIAGPVLTAGGEEYHWDGGRAEWSLGTNWSPDRSSPDPTDEMRIHSGSGGPTVNYGDIVSTVEIYNNNSLLHWGGTLEITEDLYVGYETTGAYKLNGSGASLIANKMYIGSSGTGAFVHMAGNCSVSNTLLLGGNGASALGTYSLSGGTLTVNGDCEVGSYGDGVFTMTGGYHNVANDKTLYIGRYSGSGGTYNLDGGELSASTIDIGTSGIGRLKWTAGALVTTDITITGGGDMSVGSGIYWYYEGGLTISGGQLRLNASHGSFTLEDQEDEAVATLSAGLMSARYEGIGNGSTRASGYWSGRFTQTGGTNSVTRDLVLGWDDDGNGVYSLEGGILSPDRVYVGYEGDGTFTQTGGTHSINGPYGELIVGNVSGSEGEYTLSNGTLSIGHEVYVGYGGDGTFTQSGGTHTLGGTSSVLYLGWAAVGSGTYALSGGTLSVGDEVHLGYSGEGAFTQTGGTFTISGGDDEILWIGYSSGSTGSYDLSGGTFSAKEISVGAQGSGSVVQSGGTLTVQDAFTLGGVANSDGTYTILGDFSETTGVTAGGLFVGLGGTGVLEVGDDQTPTTATIAVTDLIQYQTDPIRSASIYFGADGTFTVAAPDGEESECIMTLTDADAAFVICENASGTNLSGLGSLTVIFEGEDGEGGPKTIEVAGEDKGAGLPSAAEFNAANFLIDQLTVGEDATGPVTLRLIDDHDNRAGVEALYANTLALDEYGRIDLNALNLYYKNGGDPKRLIVGDADLSYYVDDDDLSLLLANWDTETGWKKGEFDCEGVVDDDDLSLLLAHWGEGGEEDGGGGGEEDGGEANDPFVTFVFQESVTIDSNSYKVWEMRVTTEAEWTNARMDLELTSGTMYQDPMGSSVEPNPAWFQFVPNLEYDTYAAVPAGYPRVANFAALTMDDDEFLASWFDVLDDGSGTHRIAQVTLSTNAGGTVTGRIYDLATLGEGAAFEFDVEDGNFLEPE